MDLIKTPKEKAEDLIQETKYNFSYCNNILAKNIAIKIQEAIIENLSDRMIRSEYENQLLIELKNFKQ